MSLGFQTSKKLASAPALNENPAKTLAQPLGVALGVNVAASSAQASRLTLTVAEAALSRTVIPKATWGENCEMRESDL